MPISSTQISGLVGGNQVAFANSAAYSQQLGSLYGTGPQISPPSMQNPFPSYGGGENPMGNAGMGSGAIGGAAMSMPAIAGGVGMAGAMIGGAAGWLDPFTGMARAANAGSGAGVSAGFGGLSHIGRSFVQGGMRAGMGALGGGAMAAGAMALPYMAAGAGIQGAAESVYEGAQTYGDAGRIGQQFGPAYGVSGSLPGGKLPRDQIRQIATVLEEFADENIIASVTTATRLAQKFTQMGMMSGVQDAASFKQKFSALAKQVDTVAKVMGTSLEEAAPVLKSMQSMGLWRPEDVMGTLMTSKMVGPQAAQQMMGAMQTGAQQSHALGGSLAAGASLGREAFMTVQGGLRTGTFSNESVTEYTGGVGGVEGQRMMAQTMTSAIQRASRHPMYQAMMQGLGEIKGGEYTGRIDEDLLEEFTAGGVSASQLMSRGRQRVAGKGGDKKRLSFDLRRDQLGQEMVTKGGIAGMSAGLESIMSQRGDWDDKSDAVKTRLIEMVTGSDNRTAQMIKRVMDDHEKIQGDHERRAMDAAKDYYQQRERRANQSWQGFKDAVTQKTEQAWRPLRELGADLSRGYDETRDSVVRGVLGINRGINVTSSQRRTMAMRGQMTFGKQPAYASGASEAGGFDLGLTGMMNYGTANRGDVLMQGMSESSLQEEGEDYGGIAAGAARGAVAGGLFGAAMSGGTFAGAGAVAGAVTGAAFNYSTGGAGSITDSGRMVMGRNSQGQRMSANRASVESERRRIVSRAQTSDSYALGFQGEDSGKNLEVVKSAMRSLSGSMEGRNALRKIKEDGGSHTAQTKKIMGLLKGSSQSVRKAVNDLVKSKGSGNVEQDTMDVMRVVQGEVALPDSMTIDWSKNVDAVAWANMDDEAFKELEGDAADEAVKGLMASTGMGTLGDTIASYASAGAMGGLAAGVVAGAGVLSLPAALVGTALGGVGGAIGGAAVYMFGEGGESADAVRALATDPDVAVDLQAYLSGDKDAGRRLMTSKNPLVEKMMKVWDKDKGARDIAARALEKTVGTIQFKAGAATVKERQDAAKSALANVEKLKMSGENKAEFTAALKSISTGDGAAQAAAIERLGELGQGMLKSGGRSQLKQAGTFGRLAIGMGEIEGISDAKDAKGFAAIRKRISKQFGGDIFEQMDDRVNEMIRSGGGLSTDELQELEGEAKKRGTQLSVRSAKGAKGGPMGELMGQLTTYTAANQKFVHTVAASISGIDTGDLKSAADKLSEIMGQPGEENSPKQKSSWWSSW